MANVKRAALVKARERRVALDRDRQARDSRVEQAAARVFLGVQQRDGAQRAVHDANVGIGRALLELLAERIAVEDVAELCDLDTSDVRRLVRLPAVSESGPGVAQADAAAPAGAVGETAETGEAGEAGSATVTQFRRRPPEADADADVVADADADAAVIAVTAAVPVEVAVAVPVEGESAGATRRAE